ncbi:DUF1648 domain-containing protein [Pseudogemmatithrix spongiicola]|uniref:DUF1648 domain-containing protein n=1 Tax=Pseudogemmatithrix spongiicola TaxID=3062599 RepID=A0AA49K2F5_9BACT|nr:DUF1648 domain-containing protein [Gemmatimonadaceae bacterium 'strain 138']WKW16118.1 DUF1648 domain-containing protein [Gemmatimonadaceae bacterium 'strain 318']
MPMLRVLPWALCAALALFSFATYGSLPESIPQHFDAAGNITSSTPRSPWSWAMVPIVAFATQALLAGLGALLPRQPELFNFSAKERFLRLPAEYRGPVVERMRELLDVTSAFTVLVFGIVQFMIWRAAFGHSADGLVIGLIVVSVLFTPGIFLLTGRVNTAVDEAEQRWNASQRHS